MPAANVLRVFSVLIIIIPLLSLYTNYYTTQGKTKELAYLILGSAILNIIFNFIGINHGMNIAGDMGAVYGACIATILSRILYLVGLWIFRRK